MVGSGAYARDITGVVGGATDRVWFTSVIAILTVVLGPPTSQAADYWGRKWFLVGLSACGTIGSIVISRSNTIEMAIAGLLLAACRSELSRY